MCCSCQRLHLQTTQAAGKKLARSLLQELSDKYRALDEEDLAFFHDLGSDAAVLLRQGVAAFSPRVRRRKEDDACALLLVGWRSYHSLVGFV